jgi:hypothetical protein
MQIPKKEEIVKIPVFAMIAFAARCARRVQPLFVACWTDAPKKYIQAIEDAISLAEKTAKTGEHPDQEEKKSVSNILYEAIDAAERDYVIDTYVALSAKCALDAATKVPLKAATGLPRTAANYIADYASKAVDAAAQAAKKYLSTDDTYKVFLKAVWSDFDKLKTKAKEKGWSNSSPIPKHFFGDLWPEGKPNGWPS